MFFLFCPFSKESKQKFAQQMKDRVECIVTTFLGKHSDLYCRTFSILALKKLLFLMYISSRNLSFQTQNKAQNWSILIFSETKQ